MKEIKLFCFGFGQVARFFIKKLIEEKYKINLTVTNSKETKELIFEKQMFKSYFFKNDNYDQKLLKDLNSSNFILVSIPPIDGCDIVAKFLEKNVKNFNLKKITYLSATSVFGDKKGDWVNEDSELNPSSIRGKARLVAEKKWMKLFKEKNIAIQIFRLSGIYSLENNIFNRIKTGSLKIVNKPNHFFSRIHVEDISNILILSLNNFRPGEIYNLADDYPCSNEELALYASSLMKLDKPQIIDIEQMPSEKMKSFYKDSKKVSNAKVKNFFSYKLKFPSYKEGLSSIYNHLF